jgi:uncharacterized membrane protein
VNALSLQSEDPLSKPNPSSSELGTNELTVDPADANENKWVGVLAYIIFFLPLIVAKQSRFAMFHANQGLLVFLLCIAANVVLGFIPIIGWILLPFANLAALGLSIYGIIQAANGQLKPLPVIGGVTLIKTP